MKFKLVIMAAAIASMFSVSAKAALPIFSDNFDSYTPAQGNWNPPASSGWTVTNELGLI